MFIPTSSAEIPSGKIHVHKELLNPFEQLAFDLLVIVQVVVGSLMFECSAHHFNTSMHYNYYGQVEVVERHN